MTCAFSFLDKSSIYDGELPQTPPTRTIKLAHKGKPQIFSVFGWPRRCWKQHFPTTAQLHTRVARCCPNDKCRL